jgi:phosphogluconate dehydratase
MPELHGLTPALGALMDRGHKVALVTDGRMSGASGKVPAAIQVSPESVAGGPLARLRDGDVIRLDAEHGRLDILTDPAEFAARSVVEVPRPAWEGVGRELFGALRNAVGPAEHGATVFGEQLTSIGDLV